VRIQYKAKGSTGVATAQAGGDGDTFVIRGYASFFNQRDSSGDVTKRGCFAHNSVPLPLLWAHETKTMPLGVVTFLGEDREGLLFEAQIAADTMNGYAAKRAIQLGGLSGVSYGYAAPVTKNGYLGSERVRELHKVDLAELSLCVFPMLWTARVRSWDTKSIASMVADRVILAKLEHLKAKGIMPHPRHQIDACAALGREIERIEYNGMTWEQWAQKQLAEIGKMLRETGAVAEYNPSVSSA